MPEPRWKYVGAEKFSLESPISGVYEQMKNLSPIKSFFIQTVIVVEADLCQSELLNSACFGHPILVGPGESVSSNHVNCQLSTNQNDDIFLYELGLEEAYFLCHELNFLNVYLKCKEGEVVLDASELWVLMSKKKMGFCYFYKAYHHLRQKNWIVRTGLQYGADFIAYRHHPTQVHAEYAVLVVPEWENHMQLKSWSHMQGIIRLCGSVAKTLLVLHISQIEVDDSRPNCLDKLLVREMEVKRWLPNKNRMNNSASRSKVSRSQTNGKMLIMCHQGKLLFYN